MSFVFSERYRPDTVIEGSVYSPDDELISRGEKKAGTPKTLCILPDRLLSMGKSIVESGNLQSMIFDGPPGSGKTSLAIALCKDLGIEYKVVNGSNEGRLLDDLRTHTERFVTTRSVAKNGKVKVVIFDEGDNASKDVQNALKGFMEKHIDYARFIITTNHKHKLLEALQSRCDVIDFHYSDKEKVDMNFTFFERIKKVCANEGFTVTPGGEEALAKLISWKSPNFRSIFNIVQSAILRCKDTKEINEDILVLINDEDFTKLMEMMQVSNFSLCKEFSVNHSDKFDYIIDNIYQNGLTWFSPSGYASAIIILGRYQFQHEFVANKEINLFAMFVEMGMTCEFKPKSA